MGEVGGEVVEGDDGWVMVEAEYGGEGRLRLPCSLTWLVRGGCLTTSRPNFRAVTIEVGKEDLTGLIHDCHCVLFR